MAGMKEEDCPVCGPRPQEREYENAREMDATLKDYIYRFFIGPGMMKHNEALEATGELETFLRDNGFDLGCVCKYKKP